MTNSCVVKLTRATFVAQGIRQLTMKPPSTPNNCPVM